MIIARYRHYILWGSVGIIVFLILYYNPFRSARHVPGNVRELNQIREDWEMQTYVSLANHSDLKESVNALVEGAENLHYIDSHNTRGLKEQIFNALHIFSSFDFERYIEFRMPCGSGVNVGFVREELNEHLNLLGLEPDSIVGQDFWEYMFETAKSTALFAESQGTNGRWCYDCWKGYSPEQSWVIISDSPIPMSKASSSGKHLGFESIRSDLRLSPPDGQGNISTPKLYAMVKLHVDIGEHYLSPDKTESNHYPVYLVFALTTSPECWVPVEFGVAARFYYDYIF